MRLLKLVPDNTNIQFMRWRNVALIFQIVMTVAAMALVFTRGLNFGVDFVGGQSVRVAFVQPPTPERLEQQIGTLGVGSTTIQQTQQTQRIQQIQQTLQIQQIQKILQTVSICYPMGSLQRMLQVGLLGGEIIGLDMPQEL